MKHTEDSIFGDIKDFVKKEEKIIKKDINKITHPKKTHSKKKPGVSYKLIILFILVLIGMLAYYNQDIVLKLIEGQPALYNLYSHLSHQIVHKTYLGIAYASALSGLFFIMIPIEASYLLFISLGKNIFLTTLVVLFSYIFGLMISYLIGLILGKNILKKIFKSKFDSISSTVEKFGGWFLVLAIIIFLPVPFIVFILGALRFSFKKTLKILTIGFLLKFIAIYFAKDYFTGLLASLF